jgi:large subunit ribosomal protein L14e
LQRDHAFEIGRICVVNHGELAGKVVAILDIVDQARALVEGPFSGVKRQTLPFTWLSVTQVKFKCNRGARTGTLKKQMTAANVIAAYNATSWAKKAAKVAKRASLTDFQRFQVMALRQKRARAIATELNAIKKAKKSA